MTLGAGEAHLGADVVHRAKLAEAARALTRLHPRVVRRQVLLRGSDGSLAGERGRRGGASGGPVGLRHAWRWLSAI